jgi:V8-like Glu-specific endopeptidase
MKKYLVLSLLFSAMLAGQVFAASDSRLTDYEERRRNVAALLEAATVWIVAEDEDDIYQGSGFLVSEGFIATNAHVVKELGKGAIVHVLNDNLPATRAQIIAHYYDGAGKDFALLRFSPPAGIVLPVLTFNLDAKRMDRVSAWGYPAMVTQFDDRTARLQEGDTRGLKAPPVVYTEGAINSIVNRQGSDALIHSAQIASGNSGGPLVNSRGELVGINTWGYTEEEEGAFLNAALPANDLAAFLNMHGVNPQLVPGQQVTASFSPTVNQSRPSQTRKSGKAENRLRDVGSFTVEVPRGWSVAEEDKDYISLEADDESAVVSVELKDSRGKSLKQISRECAEEFGGGRPTSDDDGETYSFTFSENTVTYMGIVGDMEDGRHILLLMGGDMSNPGVEHILNSLKDK